MPSKTSFFNKTIFRKGLTRFFPLWGLYLLCQLLGLMLILDENEKYWIASNFASLPKSMALINLAYALVSAAVLFGDLYNTRMCYGLHALPMSRGSWYASHVLSGMLFSLVPTAVLAVVSLPMLAGTPVTNAWQLSLYWFAATNLQYLFFFGLAVLCALFAGNWLGLAALYGLVNFGAYIIYLLVDNFYTPLLPGVRTPSERFSNLVPAAGLTQRYIVMEKVSTLDNKGVEHLSGSFTLGPAWGYLLILAVLGLVLLAIAYLLYRRRKLESAGDFLAFPKLAPVLAVAIALAGAAASWVLLNITGIAYTLQNQLHLLFVFAGLAVSWFAGQMLLSRSTQVFHLRQWAGLGILTAVIAVSLGLTKLDVLGIADWLPQPEDVKSVELLCDGEFVELEDTSEIQDILRLHNLLLVEKKTDEQVNKEYDEFFQKYPDKEFPQKYINVYLTYHMANGNTARRNYYVGSQEEGSEIVKHYSGTIEALLNNFRGAEDVETAEDLMEYVKKPESIILDSLPVDDAYLTAETVENLFKAIIADSEAGHLSQIRVFHPYKEFENRRYEYTERLYSYNLQVNLDKNTYFYLEIFLDSENLLSWMESVGMTQEKLIEMRSEGY